MAEEQKTHFKFKIGDRVSRIGVDGPKGVVSNIRVETAKDGIKKEKKDSNNITVTVMWDNGTESHFIEEGLKHIN